VRTPPSTERNPLPVHPLHGLVPPNLPTVRQSPAAHTHTQHPRQTGPSPPRRHPNTPNPPKTQLTKVKRADRSLLSKRKSRSPFFLFFGPLSMLDSICTLSSIISMVFHVSICNHTRISLGRPGTDRKHRRQIDGMQIERGWAGKSRAHRTRIGEMRIFEGRGAGDRPGTPGDVGTGDTPGKHLGLCIWEWDGRNAMGRPKVFVFSLGVCCGIGEGGRPFSLVGP